ncbi:MAG: hypothetical protein K2W96_24580, partial [Gemmataceae bacterium]|nr:hypothetical protein [Gemmataceae bacterium]
MRTTHLDNFAGMWNSTPPALRVHGSSAFLRAGDRLARIDLDPARVAWTAERSPLRFMPGHPPPRCIQAFGGELWTDGNVVAELLAAPEGGMTVSARDAATGRRLWDRLIPAPDPAGWAEPEPAWPGAPTEEIDAFLADVPEALVACLSRTTRRSGMAGNGIEVLTLPPFACQLDAMRLDPLTGRDLWRATYPAVHVGIGERPRFRGLWATGNRIGRIDLGSGTNAFHHEAPYRYGWPVLSGSAFAAPWHSPSRAGVDWVDESGRLLRSASWPLKGVRSTMLHPVDAGLVVQTNDQRLWLVGDEDAPLWDVRARPYICGVHQRGSLPVFVGTDGGGGRLLGFDLATGAELLNLRPSIGGVGQIEKVPGHPVLVARYAVSRSWHRAARLLLLDMRTLEHELPIDCVHLLGTWEHGAVCLVGDRVSVLDARPQPS